ncbi:MAG: response regulator [Hyphomicrobiaceae bacterium]|nr:response regulator transcription factor [Hyphomicrobiaceae bacterium]
MHALNSDTPIAGQALAASKCVRQSVNRDTDVTAEAVQNACHDLRQPLQTLILLQALLAKVVEGERAQALVSRVGTAIDAAIAILDGLSESRPAQQGAASLVAAPPKDANVSEIAPIAGEFAPVVFVVDDDCDVRAAIRSVLEHDGQVVEEFASCEAFLKHDPRDRDGCLLVDAYLPGMGGLELLQRLQAQGHTLPAIMITGDSDVAMAVNAMKAGAIDFIEKPIGRDALLACIERAVDQSKDQNKRLAWRQDAVRHIGGLSTRQRQIMDLVLAGHPSKNIAADLGISQRTVENHRAAIMKRTGTKSLPALARLAVTAATEKPDML